MTSYSNPHYSSPGNLTIDLTVTDAASTYLTTTAEGEPLFARAVAGEFGPVAPYVAPVLSKEALYANAARMREHLAAGVLSVTVDTFSIKVCTDAQHLASLTSRARQAAMNPAATFLWVQSGGAEKFTLSATQMLQVVAAVDHRDQALFDSLSTLHDQIAAGTVTTLQQIIDFAWGA